MDDEDGKKPLYIYSQAPDLGIITVYKILENDVSTFGEIGQPGILYVGSVEKSTGGGEYIVTCTND